MPLDDACDLVDKARRCERMVERTDLSTIEERVAVLPSQTFCEINETRVAEGRHRIFEVMRIAVADNENIGIIARGRVSRQPIRHGGRRRRSCRIAISLAIARVGVADRITRRAFRLQMDDGDRELGTVRVLREGLGEDGSVARVDETRVDIRIEHGEWAGQADSRTLINKTCLDTVIANRAGS